MLGVALLGAGRIGKVHARTLSRLSQARLIAVSDRDLSAAAHLADMYSADVRSVAQILSADDVVAVLICTPTDTHATLIEDCARAGKAIFCEKPVDLNPSRVQACLSVVKSCDAKLMIGFNRRFDPHFQALKATIDAGQIGEIEQITIISRDPGLPPMSYVSRSGGIFRDMTIHDFDMARFLLGEDVTHVFATGSVLVDQDVAKHGDFDTATVILRTAPGAQVTIINARRACYGYDQRIEVHGSLGMVQAENQRAAQIELATSHGFTRPALHGFFMDRYTAAFEAEISAFVSALQGDAAMSPTGEDGLAAQMIAEAAARSALSGQFEPV